MSFSYLSVTIRNMAGEGDDVFERCLQETLHSLEEMGLKFNLKAEQRKGIAIASLAFCVSRFSLSLPFQTPATQAKKECVT